MEGERNRTVGQLRLFADHVENGDYLDRRNDVAFTNRVPLPRPDLRLIQPPVVPVAVFGASNFPLTFFNSRWCYCSCPSRPLLSGLHLLNGYMENYIYLAITECIAIITR